MQRDDVLYVTEATRPHPIEGYSKAHKEYSVIDLRSYRRGYEPRLEIQGIYTPNPKDTFRLQDGHLPAYQPTTTGDQLLSELRRRGLHKAFRIAPVYSTQTTSQKYVRVLSPGQTVFYFDDLVLKESFNKENERVRKLGQNPATGEVWEEGKPRRLPQSETISLPEEGIFKVGDVFKTPRGEVILDFYAGADRKWVVTYEPEGKRVRLDVVTMDKMVDSGEWVHQPKEVSFSDLEFLATVKDLSKLTQFCKQNPQKLDMIMRVLYLAGVDDRDIDYISGGLWARKKAIIGLTVEEGTFPPDIINLLAATEGDPLRKFCCRQCGECAPKELLEEGKFPERIAWLRHHYKAKHPGLWGKVAVTPVTPEVIDITKGVIKRGRELVANPDNIPAARAFVAELRRQANEAEARALATTESKARILNQNARQARRDADRIEKTIPAIPRAEAGMPAVIPTEPSSLKEPWQMTLEEYAYAEASKYGHGKPRIDWIKAGYGETYRSHKTAVQRALKEGKPVAAEVLKDYPELQRELSSAVIPTDGKKSLRVGDKVKSSAWKEIGGLPWLTVKGVYTTTWGGQPILEVEVTDGITTNRVFEDTIVAHKPSNLEPAVIPTEPLLPSPKQELEFVSDSPEYLAFTIDDIGYREKLDTAFETAIARAKGG